MAKPPINTSERSPLQGSPMMRVELLGLQSVVRKMKNRTHGYGSMTVAKEINETILKDSEIKLSSMAVNRWWNKYGKDNDEDDSDMVNIYGSTLDTLASLNKQLNILDTYLDEMNSKVDTVEEVLKVAKETQGLMMTMEKLSMRKMAILGTIGDIQAKVYTYANFGIIMDRFETEMKKKDELWYMQVIRDITKDPLLSEVLRKIKEDGKT